MKLSHAQLAKLLGRAKLAYHSEFHRNRDPVGLVHEFVDTSDQEVAGLIAAVLAYGNVSTILNSVKTVLSWLGNRPAHSLKTHRYPRPLPRFRHRFTTEDDFEVLFFWLGHILKKHETIESFFVGNSCGDEPISCLLSSFVRRLFAISLPTHLQDIKIRRERNLKYLLSDPSRGSACKRLNMYLRWMVRSNDGIDLGIWKKISPSQLILPIDTHLLRTVRTFGWSKSKQATWRVAEAATEKLRLVSIDDPIQYDFALCHLAMSGEVIKDWVCDVGTTTPSLRRPKKKTTRQEVSINSKR